MNRPTRISLVVGLVILFGGGIGYAYWAGWLWKTADQRKVDDLKSQMAVALKEQKDPFPKPGSTFDAIRKQVSSLPEQYRKQFAEASWKMGARAFEQQIDQYLAMSKADRQKEMDKRITQMEDMRKAFEANRNQNGGAPKIPTGNGEPPRGGGGGMGGSRGLSRILDNTTPQQRAKMNLVMEDFATRRAERGLPPMPGPGSRPR